MYTYQLYWNIEELKEINEKLAEQITNVFDEKTLTENVSIIIYPTLEDYAKYEVEDGCYLEIIDKDCNEAYDLLECINYVALGEKLRKKWNKDSYYYNEDTDAVIFINY